MPSLIDWTPNRIRAIRAIRTVTGMRLAETLDFIAECFGFDTPGPPVVIGSKHAGWKTFIKWQDENKVSLESVQGPHAVTILKAIAAKHKVSTQPS